MHISQEVIKDMQQSHWQATVELKVPRVVVVVVVGSGGDGR